MPKVCSVLLCDGGWCVVSTRVLCDVWSHGELIVYAPPPSVNVYCSGLNVSSVLFKFLLFKTLTVFNSKTLFLS